MSEIKCPINITPEFLTYIRYRYTKSPHIIIEAKGKKKNPSLEVGSTYWIPEKYRLVTDESGKKLTQFFSDTYKNEKPKWIEASKMKKEYSRYSIECVKVEEKKINKIGKREAILTGAPEENLSDISDNMDITDDFRRKPIELWRLKCIWDKYASEGNEWVDNPEVFLYHVIVTRKRPEYPNYNDIHWTE